MPFAAICSAQIALLFDHLVGEQLQRVGHFEAEQSRCLRVDDELEFGRLQYRQFGWLRALEDLTGIDADLTIIVQNIGPVAISPPASTSSRWP